MNFSDLYTEGRHLQQNPDWFLEDAGWKAAMIAALLKKNGVQPASITEVGCGAGGILAALRQDMPRVQFAGYDISPQAIALAKKQEREGLQFYQADFFGMQTVPPDVLLVIDVVEHIPDYYGFLQQVQSKAAQFVFHIPLDMSCRTLLKPQVMLQQRTAVGHIHYFTQELVWWALQDTGFVVKDWQYTKPRTDTDRAKGLKRAVKKWLRNTSFALHKKKSVQLWGGYSLLILAQKAT